MFIRKIIDKSIKLEIFTIWYILATICTCITLSRQVGELYFDGSRIPEVIGYVVMIAIGWYSRSILKSLKQKDSNDEQSM